MAALAETLDRETPDATVVSAARRAGTPPPEAVPVLLPWVRTQSVNVVRHAAALRPFRAGEFGNGAAAPSDGHLQATNQLLSGLRRLLIAETRKVSRAAELATAEPSSQRLAEMVALKERAHRLVMATEKVWDFYFELFGQRQSRYADWLLSCDRIALDCYQVAYMGAGKAKPIPAPPPFSYMRTGFSPATFRRRIPLSRLGKQLNPFPLIELPYHRLVNPWTLGAVLHEVSHNLHSDMGMNRSVPRRIAARLLQAGLPAAVANTWTRWNRETFADMSGLLLGGSTIVGSLMDVIGRGPVTTITFSPSGVHPTPYLRGLVSCELLGRMGFPRRAERYRRMWRRIYPNPGAANLPPLLLSSFEKACPVVVNAICFEPYEELGGKSLAQVIPYGPKEDLMVEEAARRLAAGNDPGIIPARFLIGAARRALERRLTRPGVIARNFYRELARR